MKIQKKKIGRGGGGGVRVDVNVEVKFLRGGGQVRDGSN